MFDRRRTPLTVWFEACWMFASQKDGMSALSLQRSLEIDSYPTAWAMLHRLRSVLGPPESPPARTERHIQPTLQDQDYDAFANILK